MSDFQDIQEQHASEEAKRDRFMSEELRRQWADELLQQMVHSDEYQRKCTPAARRAEEAALIEMIDNYFNGKPREQAPARKPSN